MEIKNIISKNYDNDSNTENWNIEESLNVEQKEKQRQKRWAKIYQVEKTTSLPITLHPSFSNKIPERENKANGGKEMIKEKIQENIPEMSQSRREIKVLISSRA